MKIGAQFYTLRDHAKDLNEFSESLKRVADIGYTTVQISGVCEYTPEWLAQELKANGLKCALTHTSYDRVKNEPLAVLNEHKVFGCNYVGLGSMPGGVNEESFKKFVEDYKESARVISQNGGKLFYHNHHWEFGKMSTGELILDAITNAFTKDELGITLDTYWVQYGGASPAETIERLFGRVQCVHLKDFEIVGDEQRMASVGSGNINFERVIKACYDAGSEYLLVEQDNCYGKDPFECLKKSYEYLKSLGLN
ncbi:MAG: sugar phosphate isomerase/epimerase [Clostridia bacterium]|nr:sugar phosphate isomerase/epimerase [Clostridia bacterium]